MCAEEKNKNEILSRIVADLFAKSKGGEDLSAKIHRLREEIKNVIESEDTIFGKLIGVAESFREIIPEERQRYSAAIKALSATSKISRQEIVKAVNTQLEELKILEKVLLGTHGWRVELKAMEAKSSEMKDEITKLREKIGRLETEEKEILNGIALREKEMELVEKAVGKLFADIGTEIGYIKKRVEEPPTGEHAIYQPVPPGDSMKSGIPGEEKGGGEQKSKILEPSAPPQDTGLHKKCPMCGGRMDLQMNGEMWLCYSCAYEESGEADVQGKSEEKSAVPSAALSSNERREPIRGSIQGSSPFNKQPSTPKKTCPACANKMSWFETEKAWRCTYCGYERRI